MQLTYHDARGADRSRLIGAVIELHRWLPERFAEGVSWRICEALAGSMGSKFKWAHRIALEGRGPLRMRDDTRVSAGTRIVVAGERGSLTFHGELYLDTNVTIFAYGEVSIGAHCYIGVGAYIDGRGGLTIGEGCRMGPGAKIVSFDHALVHTEPDTMKGITIGRYVWIGANVVILDGVTVGDGAVLAAGAVVHADVLPRTVVGGVPARVLRTIEA